MHALHRDLQTKYERAIEEIYRLQSVSLDLTRETEEQEKELIELREIKLEQESKLQLTQEQIRS
jgi:hypothetical protein